MLSLTLNGLPSCLFWASSRTPCRGPCHRYNFPNGQRPASPPLLIGNHSLHSEPLSLSLSQVPPPYQHVTKDVTGDKKQIKRSHIVPLGLCISSCVILSSSLLFLLYSLAWIVWSFTPWLLFQTYFTHKKHSCNSYIYWLSMRWDGTKTRPSLMRCRGLL